MSPQQTRRVEGGLPSLALSLPARPGLGEEITSVCPRLGSQRGRLHLGTFSACNLRGVGRVLDNGVLGADLWLFIQKGPKSGKWCTFSWRQLRRLMRSLGLQESCQSLQSHSGGVRGLRPSTVGRQVQR